MLKSARCRQEEGKKRKHPCITPSPHVLNRPFSLACKEFRATSGKHWHLKVKSSKEDTYALIF